jgi:hypothetical protein
MKEERERKKILIEQKLKGGVTNLVKNLFISRMKTISANKQNEKEEEEKMLKEKHQLKAGFIGSISRGASSVSKKRFLRSQKSKNIAIQRRNTKSLKALSSKGTVERGGVMTGKFALSSLQQRNEDEEEFELEPPPENVRIKAFDWANLQRYEKKEDLIDIMYDPFRVPNQSEDESENDSPKAKQKTKKKKLRSDSKMMFKNDFGRKASKIIPLKTLTKLPTRIKKPRLRRIN